MTIYSASDYIFSPTALNKIISIILFILSAILFITVEKCKETPSWYSTLFPVIHFASAIIIVILFICIVIAIGKKLFNTIYVTDMILSTIIFILTLIVASITIATCSKSVGITDYIPAPLGMIGSICLGISTTINFINWRSQKDKYEEEEEHRAHQARPTIVAQQYRKSVMV